MNIIVVGAGFSGSIIARKIVDELNIPVTIIEKRPHIAGNMYDELDEHNILVQKYGPHVLVSNNWNVIKCLQKYSSMKPYVVKELTVIDGKYVRLPYNYESIQQLVGPEKAMHILSKLRNSYPDKKKIPIRELIQTTDSELNAFAQMLYDKAYRTYCAKQWGLSPDILDYSIMDRVPLYLSYQERYMDKDFQFIPEKGFTKLFEKILDHPKIKIKLNTDFNEKSEMKNKHIYYDGEKVDLLVYTGALDELFNNKYGELPYRSLNIEYEWQDVPRVFPEAIISYPQAIGYTRKTEYRYLSGGNNPKGTTIATEYPCSYKKGTSLTPFYPVITDETKKIYEQYKNELNQYPGVFVCGRLAEFRYYNMDECIEQAYHTYKTISSYLRNNPNIGE